MLKKSKELSLLTKIAKKQRTEDVTDIILFGSAVRGKAEPGDFDICVVFREKIDLKKVKNIEKNFGKKEIKVHLSFLTIDNFFTKPHSLAKTLLLEGMSLITGKSISENYGLENKTLFLYELKSMKSSEKVKFLYALKGRREKPGILDGIKEKIVAQSLIIVPTKEEHKIVSVLEYWNVKYKRMKILV